MSTPEEAVDNGPSNVCKAAATADIAAVKAGVEKNKALVNAVDEQGHSPLHWAALNNHQNVLRFLLENDADIHAANGEGATPLHWAVVRNALPCLEALLRAGANKHAKDYKGYQPCHVAAQYGHTSALYHLVLRWNCDFNALDADNRTPLHWAAYKGFHDAVRLLLVLGCDPNAQDSTGCNALHWACIRGNSEAATILTQVGGLSLVQAEDNMNNTPAQCAKMGNHFMLSHHINSEERKMRHRAAAQNQFLQAITRMHFAPVIWAACLLTIAVFFLKVMGTAPGTPPPLPWMILASFVVLVSFSFGLVLMAAVNVSDPGYVPKRGERLRPKSRVYTALVDDNDLDCPALWAGNWEQLCVTCKIVRPLRSKHDPVSDRCIEVFDHFCPWVGNAIGKHNRHLFLMFIGCMFVAIVLGYVLAVARLAQSGFFEWGPRHRHRSSPTMIWSLSWLICNIPLLFTVVGLAVAQTIQVAQNMTTNEMSNWPRYKHFRRQSEDKVATTFTNPFDKGIMYNFHELCFPIEYPMLPAYLETPEQLRMRQRLDGLKMNRA